MGQNGTGKSTLVKAFTGIYRQDAGEMRLESRPIRPDSPLAAQRLGINAVYREVSLCPNLSVAEIVFIGRQPTKLGRIDWRTLSSCSIAIQQMVAIVRVMDISAKILTLDEPTSSLDDNEVAQLFKVIRKLHDEEMAILFITHILDQTYELSDRITILKNGVLVGEKQTAKLSKLELIAKMLGKELSEFSFAEAETAPRRPADAATAGSALLRITSLGARGSIAPFDFELGRGEVLGLAGLLGSGRTEMGRLVFGIDQANLAPPRRAVVAGLGFCSEDRKSEGILGELSVREIIILALQARKGSFHYISPKKQAEIADGMIKSLGIKTPGSANAAGQLSDATSSK